MMMKLWLVFSDHTPPLNRTPTYYVRTYIRHCACIQTHIHTHSHPHAHTHTHTHTTYHDREQHFEIEVSMEDAQEYEQSNLNGSVH